MKHISSQFNIPTNVSRVTDILTDAGFEAFLVGGCVRDLIMGKSPKDFDITTNAKPEDIVKLFETAELKVVYENTFGTVMVIFEEEPLDSPTRQIEITPYRRETTYSDARHPDQVMFADKLEDDLMRRDFTMNALAYNPVTRETIDLYNGLEDINNKTIRTVGEANERFGEDALRMMRAVRFAAQLGFSVSHETLLGIENNKELLQKVSQERIRDEFVKIINSPSPITGIGFMVQLGLMEYVMPELLEGVGCEQGGVHKYDVFEHLLHACQHAADKGYSFHVKLAALFHDIGKPRTRRPGHKKAYTFYGHEVVGARMAEKIMNRMKFPKADIDMVVKLVRNHMFFSDTEQITLSAVRRIIQKVGVENIWTLMTVRECDRVGMAKSEAPFRLRKYFAMIEEALRDPISVSQLAIDGNYLMKDLGVKPGRRMGWILHALLEEVLEDPSKNTVENLSIRVKQLEELPDAELMKLGEAGKEKKEELEEQEVEKLHVKHHVAGKPKGK
jgi:poly(A) polymerase/tRNA nucleotidyltransferase (CCA-adding enzyme)